MKLSALPSSPYASSRVQPSALSASTGRVRLAPPQAEVQRSGNRIVSGIAILSVIINLLGLGSVIMQREVIQKQGALMKHQGALIKDLKKELEQCVNAPAVDESRLDIFKRPESLKKPN